MWIDNTKANIVGAGGGGGGSGTLQMDTNNEQLQRLYRIVAELLRLGLKYLPITTPSDPDFGHMMVWRRPDSKNRLGIYFGKDMPSDAGSICVVETLGAEEAQYQINNHEWVRLIPRINRVFEDTPAVTDPVINRDALEIAGQWDRALDRVALTLQVSEYKSELVNVQAVRDFLHYLISRQFHVPEPPHTVTEKYCLLNWVWPYGVAEPTMEVSIQFSHYGPILFVRDRRGVDRGELGKLVRTESLLLRSKRYVYHTLKNLYRDACGQGRMPKPEVPAAQAPKEVLKAAPRPSFFHRTISPEEAPGRIKLGAQMLDPVPKPAPETRHFKMHKKGANSYLFTRNGVRVHLIYASTPEMAADAFVELLRRQNPESTVVLAYD